MASDNDRCCQLKFIIFFCSELVYLEKVKLGMDNQGCIKCCISVKFTTDVQIVPCTEKKKSPQWPCGSLSPPLMNRRHLSADAIVLVKLLAMSSGMCKQCLLPLLYLSLGLASFNMYKLILFPN